MGSFQALRVKAKAERWPGATGSGRLSQWQGGLRSAWELRPRRPDQAAGQQCDQEGPLSPRPGPGRGLLEAEVLCLCLSSGSPSGSISPLLRRPGYQTGAAQPEQAGC